MRPLAVPEDRSQKRGVGGGHSRGGAFLPLPASRSSGRPLAYGREPPIPTSSLQAVLTPACLCITFPEHVCPSAQAPFSCKDNSPIGLGPSPMTSSYPGASAKTLFPSRGTFPGTREDFSTTFLEGGKSTRHNSPPLLPILCSLPLPLAPRRVLCSRVVRGPGCG